MLIELNNEERNLVLACMDAAIKHAANSMQAASALLPLALKFQSMKEEDGDPSP